jgi:hypothetical protein
MLPDEPRVKPDIGTDVPEDERPQEIQDERECRTYLRLKTCRAGYPIRIAQTFYCDANASFWNAGIYGAIKSLLKPTIARDLSKPPKRMPTVSDNFD